jgi:hypothetical protein
MPFWAGHVGAEAVIRCFVRSDVAELRRHTSRDRECRRPSAVPPAYPPMATNTLAQNLGVVRVQITSTRTHPKAGVDLPSPPWLAG